MWGHRALILALLFVACGATPVADRTSSPSPSAPTQYTSSPVAPYKATLELGYSCDDVGVMGVDFSGDGKADDPKGIAAAVLWERAFGADLVRRIQKGEPPGEGGDPYNGRGKWVHNGESPPVARSGDPLSYRLHHGDTDAWTWEVPGVCGPD